MTGEELLIFDIPPRPVPELSTAERTEVARGMTLEHFHK
jgi:hypothetical protein